MLDSVESFDGLECLVVFGVHLDGPTSDAIHRSHIYRSITRAQLLFFLVNENVPGGWLQWLQLVKLDVGEFSGETERKAILEPTKRKV